MLIERKIFDKKYEHLKSGNYFKVREVYDENFSTISSRSSQLEGGLELESLEMVHVTRKIKYPSYYSVSTTKHGSYSF